MSVGRQYEVLVSDRVRIDSTRILHESEGFICKPLITPQMEASDSPEG